jgi:hypothetical protein
MILITICNFILKGEASTSSSTFLHDFVTPDDGQRTQPKHVVA